MEKTPQRSTVDGLLISYNKVSGLHPAQAVGSNTSLCFVHSATGSSSLRSNASYSLAGLLNQQHCCQVVMVSDC